ncbi:MSC_0623 family F1-like ATPase-associated protein [Metamycoplasma buccale]|uniref:MSC_0623 family F1-like ATPase-associated protein n=1 Tax=Metamycoplasma buccale TaxID=55602 RepID=UPI00398EDA54
MSNKKQENLENKITLDFFSDYDNLVKKENFIAYDKVLASILLKNNSSFDSDLYKEFYNAVTHSIKNKLPIIFNKFSINFDMNLKFSTITRVPKLILSDDVNVVASESEEGANLKSSTDVMYNKFLATLNDEIITLIAKNYIVEILPNIIMFMSENTESLKLFFAKSLTMGMIG